jgi:hypothetical protein
MSAWSPTFIIYPDSLTAVGRGSPEEAGREFLVLPGRPQRQLLGHRDSCKAQDRVGSLPGSNNYFI